MNITKTLANLLVEPQQRWARRALLGLLSQLQGGCVVVSQRGYESQTLGDRNGEICVELQVRDDEMFARILKGGSIAAAHAYINDAWRCSDLHALLLLLARNQQQLDALEKRMHWVSQVWQKLHYWKKRNTQEQAKKNILAHYDLGNAFYQGFLDKSMQYSSAWFVRESLSLEQAQVAKLERICQQLHLRRDDHLLEIGTGWGALAIHAAKNYGCRVTTTTISDEQYRYVKAKIKEQGLEKQITLLNQDYRQLQGQFDKLASIEMIEAVGEAYLPDFVKSCAKLLRSEGRMLLQSITIAQSRFENYRKRVDFIQQCVFPGGFLPSHDLIEQCFSPYFDLNECLEMRKSYARTLRLWHERVVASREALSNSCGLDDAFYRLWHFYFAYCEAGFRTENIGTEQLTFIRRSDAHVA